jgi:amidase
MALQEPCVDKFRIRGASFNSTSAMSPRRMCDPKNADLASGHRHPRRQSLLGASVLIIVLSACSIPQTRPAAVTPDRAFIVYWAPPPESKELRLAIKDLIDIKGVVTTAGSEYLAKTRPPALDDAKCLQIARIRDVRIVGKTNLSEFALGVSGVNEYYGTPRNPLNRRIKLIPGASSSGSAVAVADGMADVAFGTDTAGSIRTPAACCGVLGLKTTFGLVSLKGVFPLSPKHLDTVGPMAKDVAHLVEGMDLLQSGFAARYQRAVADKFSASEIKIGRLYLDGTDPAIDRALDAALAAKHFQVIVLDEAFKAKWDQAQHDGATVALGDAWLNDVAYEDKPEVGKIAKAAILRGALAYATNYTAALQRASAWRRDLRQIFEKVDFIAVPTLQKLPPILPPKLPFYGRPVALELEVLNAQNTPAVDLAGNPAVAIPIPITAKTVPVTSLQLVGRRFSEPELLNAARLIESP